MHCKYIFEDTLKGHQSLCQVKQLWKGCCSRESRKAVSQVQLAFMCKFHFDGLVKKKKHGLDLLGSTVEY